MLVFTTDADGLHGKAMLKPVINDKLQAKVDKKAQKTLDKNKDKTFAQVYEEAKESLAKLVKKGMMSQAQMDETLSGMEKQMTDGVIDPNAKIGEMDTNDVKISSDIRPLQFEEKRGKRTYKIEEWKKEHPAEWHIATYNDGKQLMRAITGGLGMENKFKKADMAKITAKFAKDNTLWSMPLYQILLQGMIVYNDNTGEVSFIRNWSQSINPGTVWMEADPTYGGNEMTVAVTEF